MNINIETKYKIGDTVYIAEKYEDYFPSKPLTVLSILVTILPDATLIEYGLGKDGYCDKIPENRILPTYEECIKWCQENN